jgi:hypothetical protein
MHFHHKNDSNAFCLKNQAHIMDDIIISQSSTSNALLVYNPRNQKYYKPDSYHIDLYRLPFLVYPTITYDGVLFVSLHRDNLATISGPYPPGTRVVDVGAATGKTLSGTAINILFDSMLLPHYLIMFYDGTS